MEMTEMSFQIIRINLILTVIAVLIAGLFMLLWPLLVQLVPELRSLPESYRQLNDAEMKEMELSRLLEAELLVGRIQIRVAHELLQGQITLRQAVGIVRYLNEALLSNGPKRLPGVTAEVKYGRQVLAWARAQQGDFPTRFSPRAVNRLEAELEELLAGPEGWIPEINPEDIPELRSVSP
jgi:hypothetical protein